MVRCAYIYLQRARQTGLHIQPITLIYNNIMRIKMIGNVCCIGPVKPVPNTPNNGSISDMPCRVLGES